MIFRLRHLFTTKPKVLVLIAILFHLVMSSFAQELKFEAQMNQIDSPTPIPQIQGSSHISPYLRSEVTGVYGIVTALRPGHGFFIQNPVPDGDLSTSEGLYIRSRKDLGINIGDFISVDGKIKEYYPGGQSSGGLSVTQLSSPDVTVLSSGHGLPAPIVLGVEGVSPRDLVISDDADGNVETSYFDPESDGIDFWESLEGMRVAVNNPSVIGDVHTLYGEFTVLGDGGENTSGRNERGGLVLREQDPNPERIMVDVKGDPPILSSDIPMVEVGDQFSGTITGILDYSYYWYKILPSEPLPPYSKGLLARERSSIIADDDVMTIASFNVQNLSAVSPLDKMTDIATTIVLALNSPDIVVLSEIQDGDGPKNSGLVDGAATYEALIASIELAGGPKSYEFREAQPVDGKDGGEPGGNIRVGFLFNGERVGFIDNGSAGAIANPEKHDGSLGVSSSPGRIGVGSTAFTASRKPVVGEFVFGDERFVVVGVHLNSKSTDGKHFGRSQPPVLGSEGKRTRQAAEIAAFAENMLAADPNVNIIVAGDFNDFPWSPPLARLMNAGLKNTLIEHLPETERYTYVYEGNSQALDHILVTPAMELKYKISVDIVHRYAGYLYTERKSDHDPLLMSVSLP